MAHNEPTPELMDAARAQMRMAQLWSDEDTFLSQPLVQAVLRELGEPRPETLCKDLTATVRIRLVNFWQESSVDHDNGHGLITSRPEQQ